MLKSDGAGIFLVTPDIIAILELARLFQTLQQDEATRSRHSVYFLITSGSTENYQGSQ